MSTYAPYIFLAVIIFGTVIIRYMDMAREARENKNYLLVFVIWSILFVYFLNIGIVFWLYF